MVTVRSPVRLNSCLNNVAFLVNIVLDHFSKVGSFPPMSRCSNIDPLLVDALVASRTNAAVETETASFMESVRQHIVTVVAHSNLNVVELLLCLDNTILTLLVASLVVPAPAIIDYYNINCWQLVPSTYIIASTSTFHLCTNRSTCVFSII